MEKDDPLIGIHAKPIAEPNVTGRKYQNLRFSKGL
jgi:hypothetical protein